MEVILLKDYGKLGSADDIVKVKDGYARNYLMPEGIAIPANAGNKRALIEHQKYSDKREIRKVEEAKNLAKRIQEIPCTISAKAKDDEELYGSVSVSDIVAFLEKENIAVDKNMVTLSEPIKKLGVFTVAIKLHKTVSAELKVWVVKQED